MFDGFGFSLKHNYGITGTNLKLSKKYLKSKYFKIACYIPYIKIYAYYSLKILSLKLKSNFKQNFIKIVDISLKTLANTSLLQKTFISID